MKKKVFMKKCMLFMFMVLGQIAVTSQGMSVIGMCEFEKPNKIYK